MLPYFTPRPLSRLAHALALVTLALAASAPEARATTLLLLSAEEHASSAAAIVVATPRHTHSQVETTAAGETVFTYTALDVLEVVKGGIDPAAPLVVKHPGGRVGAVSLIVEGTPDLTPGVEYLLFLAADARPPYECYFVQSFALGAWRIERGAEGAWAVRYLGSAGGAVDGDASPAKPLERVRLERIRRYAQSEPLALAPQMPPGYAPGAPAALRTGTSGFTLGNGPARWRHPDRGEAIGLSVNPTNFAYAASLNAAVDWAIGQWSGVPGTSLRMVNAGPTESCGFKGANHVTSVAVDCLNEVPGQGCRGSGVIAIGGPRTFEQGTYQFNGTAFRSTLSGDVVLNDPAPDNNGNCDLFDNQAMLNAVVTHEVGHVLGLGHSDAGETGNRPTMYGWIQAGMDTLHDDDRQAIHFLYPAPESPALAPAIDGLSPAVVEQGADATFVLETRNVESASAAQVQITPAEGLDWQIRSISASAAGRARVELRLLVSDAAAPGVRTLVLTTDGGSSNAQVFTVSAMIAPTDLRAVRASTGGKRPPVDLAWSDSSAVETSIRVERLNPKSGAFEPLAEGYLPRNSTSFRDDRPLKRKPNTYRLVFVNGRTGVLAYSNTVTAQAR